MTLILIGYWQGEHAPGWPDVTAFIDPTWDEDERADIGAYVGRGIPVKHYMGFSSCRICGKPNGASELSDATYIWPSGLAHYVGDHSVRLPQQFVDHVRATVERLEDNPVDSDWWRSLKTYRYVPYRRLRDQPGLPQTPGGVSAARAHAEDPPGRGRRGVRESRAWPGPCARAAASFSGRRTNRSPTSGT